MKELASQLMSLIASIAPAAIPLIAVYIGWKLSSLSERRKRNLDNLEKRFEALRELKKVIDNIPRGLSAEQLALRIRIELDLLKSLETRLVRLFGLRRELIPHLDPKMVTFLDQRFLPLFRVETGSYELKPNVYEEFAKCCEELVNETDFIEKNWSHCMKNKQSKYSPLKIEKIVIMNFARIISKVALFPSVILNSYSHRPLRSCRCTR